MVEPTESESMHEPDRFIDAMIQIRDEIRAVEEGKLDREDNPLLNAPHTAAQVSASAWTRSYPRERAASPPAHLRQPKNNTEERHGGKGSGRKRRYRRAHAH